ncbi:MAG: PEP-CTERM sorting domain-containing protein [Armatimonas sp.]
MKVPGGIGFVRSLLTVCLLGIALARADAQLTLTFNPTAFPSVASGQQLTILATLTNLTSETVDLDVGTATGTVTGPGSPGITWEDADFVLNLPDFLASGASYSANLFLNVEATAPIGTYFASYEVAGTGRTTSDPYSGEAFAEIVVDTQVAIPEPSTLLLVGLGSGVILYYRRWK